MVRAFYSTKLDTGDAEIRQQHATSELLSLLSLLLEDELKRTSNRCRLKRIRCGSFLEGAPCLNCQSYTPRSMRRLCRPSR